MAAGRLTRIPFMWTWLRLTIMKLASRKNMMSINGMISMRARLCGIGEDSLIVALAIWYLVLGARHGESDRDFDLGNRAGLESPLPERTRCCVIQYRISDTLCH